MNFALSSPGIAMVTVWLVGMGDLFGAAGYYAESAQLKKHFYSDVPRLGNVAVSRHAQERMMDTGIPEPMFERVLFSGLDTPISTNLVWREKDGLRIVVLTNPTPNVGAKLVKTVYRVKAPARVMPG
jgi:hypothetical protein